MSDGCLGGEFEFEAGDEGAAQFYLRAKRGNVWLTQAELAALFDTTKKNIGRHIRNILLRAELPDSVVKYGFSTARDGRRYRARFYNIDLILAVGYRIRSARGKQFRKWATRLLNEYLVKGFILDDARLKEADAHDIGALSHIEREAGKCREGSEV